jgi:EspF protein repeat
MTHRPYPNRARALRQRQRHNDEWRPGGTFPARSLADLVPPAPAWLWNQPEPPAIVSLTPEQVRAIGELPQRLAAAMDSYGQRLKAGSLTAAQALARARTGGARIATLGQDAPR